MIDFVDEDGEFDIQHSVLKKRTTNNEYIVYVEYDKLTHGVISVSPNLLAESTRRSSVVQIAQSELTKKVFDSKISLSKLMIKKNQSSGKLELIQYKQRKKTEFDFVFATSNEHSYIHLNCNVVSKQIVISFDDTVFKQNFSTEKLTENDLEELPDYIEIYCIDKTERSRLFGKFSVSTKELFEKYELSFACLWLPDTDDQLKNIGFLYYNDNQIISMGNQTKIKVENNLEFKPNLLYKQHGNVLKLQSTMHDINSFRLGEEIILYLYQKYDPTKMLDTIKLNSNQLNNYNQFEIKLRSSKKIKLLCNYQYLYTKEENVNSYY